MKLKPTNENLADKKEFSDAQIEKLREKLSLGDFHKTDRVLKIFDKTP